VRLSRAPGTTSEQICKRFPNDGTTVRTGAQVRFIVNGAGLPQNSVLVSIGADLHLTSSLSVGAKFDSAIAETAQTLRP
jgi:uncharacterized protein with beta-barrel porin domain